MGSLWFWAYSKYNWSSIIFWEILKHLWPRQNSSSRSWQIEKKIHKLEKKGGKKTQKYWQKCIIGIEKQEFPCCVKLMYNQSLFSNISGLHFRAIKASQNESTSLAPKMFKMLICRPLKYMALTLHASLKLPKHCMLL